MYFRRLLRLKGKHCLTVDYKKQFLRLGNSHRGYPGKPGSGAGKGGGGGGSIKEAGGGLGELGAAKEEGYFYNKDRERLKKLKKKGVKDEEKQPKPEDDK